METHSTSTETPQYSLGKILLIWAAAAAPMGLIVWLILPVLIPSVGIVPGFLALILITLGLIWQGVLAYILLRGEVRPFTWENLKERLWLRTPVNPRTGVPSRNLYLWTIPLVLVTQAYYLSGITGFLDELWVKALPFLAEPSYMDIRSMAGPAVGQWWLLGLFAVLLVFNYLLGEELIFRGILLPKMTGVFGRWDWLANGILFSLYHVHKPSSWPSTLLIDWIYPWAAKRFKSYWVAVILHGADALLLIVLVTFAIMGMAG